MKIIFVDSKGNPSVSDKTMHEILNSFEHAEICTCHIKALDSVSSSYSSKYLLIYEDGDLNDLDINPSSELLSNHKIYGKYFIVKCTSEGDHIDLLDIDIGWVFNAIQWSTIATNIYKGDN